MSDHLLHFADLDLVTGLPPEDGAAYTLHVLAPGTEFGSPEAVISTVATLMADGEMVEHDRDGNRVHTLMVLVKGPTAYDLAMGEAALAARTKRPTTIRWAPPRSWGAVTVWPVVTSYMVLEFDDLSELRGERIYRLVVTCEPFGRSAGLTTEVPLGTSDSPVSVEFDDCTSTSGWSGSRGGVVSSLVVSSGAVTFSGLGSGSAVLTRTGAVDFSSTPYLVVQTGRRSGDRTAAVVVYADGSPLPLLGRARLESPPRTELVFAAPESAASLSFHTVASSLAVYSLVRRNTPPGSPRASRRLIPIGGTERTPGSIHIANRAAASMSTLYVHTALQVDAFPDYAPGLRVWRNSGNTVTPDTTRLSGAQEPIHPNAVIAQVPNTALPPGPYLIGAHLHKPTAGAVKIWWSVCTFNAAGDPIHPIRATATYHEFTGGIYEFVPLGIATLPVALAEGGYTEVHIQRDTGEAAIITLDEAFAFRVDEDCGLTLLGATERHVWLDGPNIEAGTRVPIPWTGTEEDRSDAHHPGLGMISAGSHPLRPGVMQVYVASEGAEWPEVEIAYYKRWHTHAPE